MPGLNRDSTFDEIDRLLDDEEFCRQVQQLHEESGETSTFDTNLLIDLNPFSPLSEQRTQAQLPRCQSRRVF